MNRAQLGEHTVAPPVLSAFADMAAVEAELTERCRDGLGDARVLAALGNILVRQGRYLDGFAAYRSATELDPQFAQAHLAASELAHLLHDEEGCASHRARALAITRVYPDPLPVDDRLPLLLLLRDAPYAVNTPLEILLDRSRVAIHKAYVCGPFDRDVPAFACAFGAFGYARDAAAEAAHAFLERSASPYVNDPARFGLLARERLPKTLAGIPGVAVVATERVARERLAIGTQPLLVRPADTQAGEGLALIDSPVMLAHYVTRQPADEYHVTPFVEYRSDDGYYRKYRVVFVDGIAYPYHVAISPRWMVHYQSSPMRELDWARKEEAAFLEAPDDVFANWGTAMPAIARALGLDYGGVDMTQLADGTLLVFEADSGLLVHDEPPNDVLAYKRPYVARIREALHRLIEGRAKQGKQVQTL